MGRHPLTSPQFTEAAGTDERYAREWLEQQAVTGPLRVDDPAAGPRERRHRLVDGVAAACAAPADDVESLICGFSLFVCLAGSTCTPGPAATGTVLRRPAPTQRSSWSTIWSGISPVARNTTRRATCTAWSAYRS